MRPFEQVRSVAIPMSEVDINTDEILPARFMSKPRVDYGRYFFHDRRFASDGSVQPECFLHHPMYKGAEILLAGRNFGCGSSREHAVFTLADFGIRVVIAPGLADIFHTNCFKNGVLPVVLPQAATARLFDLVQRQPGAPLQVDLAQQSVLAPDGERFAFEVDPFRKENMLRGVDDIDRTLAFMADIERFEAGRPDLSRGVSRT